ncbi:MAG: ISNCY family transposase [Alphaproteobacteria bacterium]|nr:ISNCY family transposase [Alphaproteobacteria bacterium]
MKAHYTMSKQEIDRLEVIQKLLDKRWTQKKASQVMQISVRQVQRLLQAYRKQGVPGLLSKKRGKPSNNKISDTVKQYAISLIKEHYVDFGPTLAAEKLFEKHDLKLSVETVRSLMINAEIWIPRNKRHKRAYQPRYRRERFGELIQIDGSNHPWFEDRGPKCTLLVYIDDATSRLTSLYFVPTESMHTYFLATRQHIERYGKPIAFYSDRLGVFRVHSKTTQEKIMTQFGRALYELNIELICANTCQAKGRVERANKTLQDRLVKELRLRNISTIAEANAYLPEFTKDYNKRFEKAPFNPVDCHRPLQKNEFLDESLCFKQERTVTHNLTIQYDRVLYLIEDTVGNRALRRKKIMLHEYPNGSISLNYKGRKLQFSKMFDRVKPIEQGEVIPNERLGAVLEFIKENQNKRSYTRSTRCPGKRHLGLTLSQVNNEL